MNSVELPNPEPPLYPNGDNVHIRMTVKYENYKKFEGKSTIKYGDVVENPKTPPPVTKK